MCLNNIINYTTTSEHHTEIKGYFCCNGNPIFENCI